MMTREQFFQIMENPASASAADLEALLELRERFPWFAPAHTLAAAAHHKQQSADRADKLKIAAVYAGDRKALFDAIHLDKLRKTIAHFEEEIATENNFSDTENLPEPEPMMLTTLSESKESEKTAEEVTMQEKISEHPEVHDDFESLLLEEEIMMEALAAVIEKEVSPSDYFEVQPNVQTPATVTQDTDAEDPFAQWLTQRSAGIGYAVQTETATPAAPAPVVSEKKSIADLIDDFIKNEPKITPGKAEEYANKVHGAGALVEDENFVTETLAAIYARQGKTAKAKRAYKLLSLKYPEKSIYFAAQIKKIDRGEL